MALNFYQGVINKEGKLMIIFSGGGKQVWYPSEEELRRMLECIKGIEDVKVKANILTEKLNEVHH